MARKSTLNRTLRFMLTMCGIWPGTPYVLLCRIFWVVSLTVTLFCHYRYFLTHVYSAEILDLMDCLSSFLAYSKIIIKFIVFWLNQRFICTIAFFSKVEFDSTDFRKLIEILAVMTEDWSDCTNNDISMREIARKAKISDRIANAVVTLHTVTIVAYCIGIILADADVTDTTKELPLINKLEIPFDINTQSTYRIILIAEFLLMILCGWAAGITNSLLLTLTLHTAGQIEIMRHRLTQLVSRKNEGESIAMTTSKIIQKHQKIISFSKNIESLYSYIALLQFVSNTIMICSLGFVIVTAIGSSNAVEQIMKSFLFFTITNLEAFIFCYAGEYLNNKSKEIGVAAYNCEWYDLKCTESRLLLFVILRSQKQLTLTVGKMMDLSLASFTSIMNASGSYLSMLLAMQ
ncbi:odorant receptor Or2-like isoform X2 [Temnothorax longispinosus]|uniref:odorant receptor Or2-like isoform X2 n=1 Tax=Temnothorax longispinosus TaxID=300112 RepID=UPI003A98E69B